MTPAPASFVSDNATNFVGDSFPLRSGVTVATGTAPTPSQYAQCVADILGIPRPSSTNYGTLFPAWCTNGYDATYTYNAANVTASTPSPAITVTAKPASKKFQGFTMGPAYWGKTFYMWPPDPRTPTPRLLQWGLRVMSPATGGSASSCRAPAHRKICRTVRCSGDSNGNWNSAKPGQQRRLHPQL